jgi:outer membrane protein TolC
MSNCASRAIKIVLLCATTSCASYHPLPLPKRADLASSVFQLHRELPGNSPNLRRVVEVDRPLDPDSIGLLAVLNDPDLRTEHGQIEIAEAQVLQTSLLPNPSANLAYGALLGGPGTSPLYAASLSEDIAAIVTYRARVSSAEAHAAQVKADQLWQEWQVAQKARLLALDLYWGTRAIEDQRQELELISDVVNKIEAATAAGNLDLATLSPLKAAQASTERSLASQQLEQLKSWQQLDGLLGLVPNVRFELAPPNLPPLAANADTLIENLPEQRPDLVALQLGYRSATEDVRAAILGQFPPFTLGGAWNSDTTGVRSAGPTITFDLPIFNRNQGHIAASEATRMLLREQYAARLDSAIAEAQGLFAQAQNLNATLIEVRQAAASAETLARSAGTAFAQANLDQRAWTDFETARLERQLEVIALEKSLGEVVIALDVELGIGLPRARIAPVDRAERP